MMNTPTPRAESDALCPDHPTSTMQDRAGNKWCGADGCRWRKGDHPQSDTPPEKARAESDAERLEFTDNDDRETKIRAHYLPPNPIRREPPSWAGWQVPFLLWRLDDARRIRSEREAELWRLRDELADLQRTFDLQWDADQRAIKQWQAAHPGNDLVWPDRCNMVVWLLDQIDRLRAPSADVHGLTTHNPTPDGTPPSPPTGVHREIAINHEGRDTVNLSPGRGRDSGDMQGNGSPCRPSPAPSADADAPHAREAAGLAQQLIDGANREGVPGGRGTADMVRRARASGIEVVEIEANLPPIEVRGDA